MKMTGKTPNKHLSYVLSITLPKPTIRIKIPKALAKVMQRRNRVCRDIDDESSENKKKWWRKAGFREKVGSVLSNVFGNNVNEGMQETGGARDEGERSQGTRNNGQEVVKKGKINKADHRVATWRRGVTIRWLGKLKITWSEKEELCKKRILLGGRCKPLANIQHDENGFLLPEL